MYQLLSPDGYYRCLGLEKPDMKRYGRYPFDSEQVETKDDSLIELINKNYHNFLSSIIQIG